jgi:negative regulator of flagellin synthesis FlgM
MSSISQLNGQERVRAALAATAFRANAPAATTTGAARQPDGVSISETARSLAAAHKVVAGGSEVREDRVAALKAAVADGTYSVDSRALAKAMVRRAINS